MLDVAQIISRDQSNAEKGSGCYYRSGGYPCRSATGLSFIAVNVDSRYNGKLSSMWVNYGENAVVGVFLPTMPWGAIPSLLTSGNGFDPYVSAKRASASDPCSSASYFNCERVQRIQKSAFYAESYGWQKYLEYLAGLPNNLSDAELYSRNTAFIADTVTQMANIYNNELLPSASAKLSVNSNPELNVPVYIDGAYIGNTPLLVELESGLHTVGVSPEVTRNE